MALFISNSPEETFDLGRQWAAEVSPGWVIGLIGDLGTGKTQLIKGLSAGMGIEATVSSPTFSLLQEHNEEGRLPLAHIDLYRLESQTEIVGAGLEHFLVSPHGVTAVEWYDRWLVTKWQPGHSIPESIQPIDGVTLRMAVFSDIGETKREIKYEDFSD